eukprot:jgi/Ulvmu1/12920/UM099_0018.1
MDDTQLHGMHLTHRTAPSSQPLVATPRTSMSAPRPTCGTGVRQQHSNGCSIIRAVVSAGPVSQLNMTPQATPTMTAATGLTPASQAIAAALAGMTPIQQMQALQQVSASLTTGSSL